MTEQEKQKQIEKMANWLKSAITDTLHDCLTDCEYCDNKYKNFGMADCLAMSEAEYLYNAGIGDTKQAVRDFAEKVSGFCDEHIKCWEQVIDIAQSKGDTTMYLNVIARRDVYFHMKNKIEELVKETCCE